MGGKKLRNFQALWQLLIAGSGVKRLLFVELDVADGLREGCRSFILGRGIVRGRICEDLIAVFIIHVILTTPSAGLYRVTVILFLKAA